MLITSSTLYPHYRQYWESKHFFDLYHLFKIDTNKDGKINISDAKILTNLLFYLQMRT